MSYNDTSYFILKYVFNLFIIHNKLNDVFKWLFLRNHSLRTTNRQQGLTRLNIL